ncbi:MAG: EMC3/TMCO1 family protein, partial [Candidatus Nanoarchaeia archaeon]
LLTTIISKYTTNQEKLKSLKADMKRLQKKATQLSKEGKKDKAMKMQKDMMKMNGKFMKSSFRSTLFTFLPIILFFGWLSVNLAFMPLLPQSTVNVSTQLQEGVSGNITLDVPEGFTIVSNQTKYLSPLQDSPAIGTWQVQAANVSGDYTLTFIDEASGEELFVDVLVTKNQRYIEPITLAENSEVFSQASVGLKKLIILEGVPFLEHFPIIKKWGWFGIYFLFAIGFSLGLKKLLKLA